MAWNITNVSLRQSLLPARLMGRVHATHQTLANLAQVVGALAAGLIADAFGLRAAFAVGAAVVIVSVAGRLMSPRIASKRPSKQPTQGSLAAGFPTEQRLENNGAQMFILKFLHIAVMFAAVATALGPELLLLRIGRSGDVRAIRTGYGLGARIGRAIPPLFFTGLILGLLTAWTGSFNFLAPWLLIAYVLFVLATVLGAGVTAPHIGRVAALAAQSPDEAPSAELTAALSGGRADTVFMVDIVIIAAFIFDMVVKPFS